MNTLKNNYLKRTISYFYNNAAFYILSLGSFLRLNHFFENRSLWLDEAYVAFNLTHLSLKDILIFTPFFGPQASPPMLFLLTEKTLMSTLGYSETVLRSFPVACSVASLILFYLFCTKFLNKKFILLALSIFAISDPLIYYAAELKPYSTDLLFSLILYLSCPFKQENSVEFKRLIFLGATGSIAIFFSYPSVFILAAIGIALLARALRSGRKADLLKIFLVCSWWMLNAFFLYYMAIRTLFKDAALIKIINLANFFPAIPFTSLSNTTLFIKFFTQNMLSPLGIFPLSLWTLITLIGLVKVFQQDKEKFILFATPIFLALAASFVQKYPFVPRFLIFLVPSYLLFLSEGIETLFSKTLFSKLTLKILLIIVLLFQPLHIMVNHVIQGREKEDTRSIMQQFQKHYKKGDAIFLNRHAIYGFGYYRGLLGMGEENMPMQKIVFNENEKQYKAYIGRYYFNKEGFMSGFLKNDPFLSKSDQTKWQRNPRTWIFLTHIKNNNHDLLISSLNKRGKMKGSYKAEGAYLYLYDLSASK